MINLLSGARVACCNGTFIFKLMDPTDHTDPHDHYDHYDHNDHKDPYGHNDHNDHFELMDGHGWTAMD